MRIAAESQGGMLLLTVEEARISADSAVEFRDTLVSWIGGQIKRVIIDLSAVDIMDSMGLGALVAAFKATGSGSQIALAGPTRAVATLLELARMDKVFRIFGSVDEAAASLQTG